MTVGKCRLCSSQLVSVKEQKGTAGGKRLGSRDGTEKHEIGACSKYHLLH